ncbi:S26 family signal peptidase [Streptomyces sp. NPDC101132]|uniref:S26 family signal peptidase n=1 Tax=Streptomyces sp. NPDC101132 TaxID=3366110 RepID=UPI0037FBE4CF
MLPLLAAAGWAAAGVLLAVGAYGAASYVAAGAGLLTLAALPARAFVLVTVRGASMEPAFHDGDRVLVRRWSAPRPGVAVVLTQGTLGGAPVRIIKRVAAVPGDPVPRAAVPALADVPEDTVPPGHLVLLGDNPAASVDSRQAGYFRTDAVLGVARRPPRRHR